MKYLIFILSFLFSMNAKSQSSQIKNEIKKVFFDIPIEKGIENILKNSNFQFDYAMNIYPMGDTLEVYAVELKQYSYKNTPVITAQFVLQQKSYEKELGCYNVHLRLYYDKKEDAAEALFIFKERFEELSTKVDTETTLNEDYDLKFQVISISFNKKYGLPNLTFSFDEAKQEEGYQVLIDYQNCLKFR